MRRFVAAGIDALGIVYLPVALYFLFAYVFSDASYSKYDTMLRREIIIAAYFVFFWTSARTMTPGMKIMKIRLVSENGRHITLAQAFIRYLWFSLPVLWLNRCQFMIDSIGSIQAWFIELMFWGKLLVFLALYIPTLYTRKHCGIPDLLSGTYIESSRAATA